MRTKILVVLVLCLFSVPVVSADVSRYLDGTFSFFLPPVSDSGGETWTPSGTSGDCDSSPVVHYGCVDDSIDSVAWFPVNDGNVTYVDSTSGTQVDHYGLDSLGSGLTLDNATLFVTVLGSVLDDLTYRLFIGATSFCVWSNVTVSPVYTRYETVIDLDATCNEGEIIREAIRDGPLTIQIYPDCLSCDPPMRVTQVGIYGWGTYVKTIGFEPWNWIFGCGIFFAFVLIFIVLMVKRRRGR